MLQDLNIKLKKDLDNSYIASKILLDKLLLINEDDRKSSAYVDSRYFPIYYYIGKYIKNTKLFEINPNLGYASCCFFKSNKDILEYTAVQDIEKNIFYPENLYFKNVKNNYKNNFNFEKNNLYNYDFNKCKNYNIVFINLINTYDKFSFCLNKCFENIDYNSYLIIDRVISDINIKNCYENFCKINNLENFILKTRYGTGIILKG